MSEETPDFWKGKHLIEPLTSQWNRAGTQVENFWHNCTNWEEKQDTRRTHQPPVLLWEGAGTEKGLVAERQILGILRSTVKKKKSEKETQLNMHTRTQENRY